ncbi:hypothetical protein JAAARDRAFT_256564 [Jaapia argillacea MUCL 33604]|uniref:EH domain-containing protein n=1 Tax=Jaapia argillacea MUCL 33604 TaxID=933084 RepID=A0A067PTE4_9AGAM|nr:hypothetical protein JAAARDRAFT_256564 [Jaapia argillacea MUCL 33604]
MSLSPTPEELVLVDKMFAHPVAQKLGMLVGEVALDLFGGSNLSPEVLSQVWAVADSNRSGSLTKRETIAAVRLMGWAQRGERISRKLLNEPGPLPYIIGVSPTLPPLTSHDKTRFLEIFEDAIPINGLLSGEKARDILVQSKLPVDKLTQIWALSDKRKRGSLDSADFAVAMYLIRCCTSGVLTTIPACLPSQVYEQAKHPIEGGGEWEITEEERIRSDRCFDVLDPKGKGYIIGEVAVPFMRRSKLNDDLLIKVWDLADTGKKGRLSPQGLAIAIHLINRVLSGKKLPSAFPQELLRSSANRPRAVDYGPVLPAEEILRDAFRPHSSHQQKRQQDAHDAHQQTPTGSSSPPLPNSSSSSSRNHRLTPSITSRTPSVHSFHSSHSHHSAHSPTLTRRASRRIAPYGPLALRSWIHSLRPDRPSQRECDQKRFEERLDVRQDRDEQCERGLHMHFLSEGRDREDASEEGINDIWDAATGLARLTDALFAGIVIQPIYDSNTPHIPPRMEVKLVTTRQFKMNPKYRETLEEVVEVLKREIGLPHVESFPSRVREVERERWEEGRSDDSSVRGGSLNRDEIGVAGFDAEPTRDDFFAGYVRGDFETESLRGDFDAVSLRSGLGVEARDVVVNGIAHGDVTPSTGSEGFRTAQGTPSSPRSVHGAETQTRPPAPSTPPEASLPSPHIPPYVSLASSLAESDRSPSPTPSIPSSIHTIPSMSSRRSSTQSSLLTSPSSSRGNSVRVTGPSPLPRPPSGFSSIQFTTSPSRCHCIFVFARQTSLSNRFHLPPIHFGR